MRYRSASLSAIAVSLLFVSATALAQDSANTPPPIPGDDIIVTGTRAQGRTQIDSASPVDVLSGKSLRAQGTTELGAALANVAPSIDFPRPSATDGTDAIRPATLRGLSPDETLVLINGVRANSSSLLNVNGSVGRGSSAVDLNTIPITAIDRIEVLRDGASAQYGSDAIAGVINVRLREERSGGGASVTYGFYDTDVNTARGADRQIIGEPAVTASVWQGFGFGEDGFVTVSGEFLKRDATNRADYDPRYQQYLRESVITGRFGDPDVKQYTGFLNAGTSISPNWKLYGWVGYQNRESSSAAFPRLPVLSDGTVTCPAGTCTAGVVSGIWPDGFLPLIGTKSTNWNTALGLKGDVAGWNVDLKVSYGRNQIDYYTRNSANYTYGNTSNQTNFYDGSTTYDQWVGGINVDRDFHVFQSLNVAFGVEGRREGYKIAPGELASYDGSGAQGFVGFSPLNIVDQHRENISAYVDLEAQVTKALLIGVAGRYEHYSDFGDTANAKVSLRYDFTPWLALRGTFSTGFRAPSLQEEYYTSITSVVVGGTPILTGTFPATSAPAVALGGQPLQPEKSTNYSVGAVLHSGGFELTVDAYQINVRNGIGLSENITTSSSQSAATNAAISNILQSAIPGSNISAARFFINGIGFWTRGIDAVAHYRLKTRSVGQFDFTVSGNINQIVVTSVPDSLATLGAGVASPVLFARSRILTLEAGTPGEKAVGTIDWSSGDLGFLVRGSYYGDVNQPGTLADGTADIHTGRHFITDLELRYQIRKGPQFALGVNNLFDIYPNMTSGTPTSAGASLNSTGVVAFPFYSPFGFNGRYLYARVGINW